MEARFPIRRVPIQPILVVLTVLFALVLGLLAGYGAGRIDTRVPTAPAPRVAPVTGFEGPDAIERNERLSAWIADRNGH